MMNKLADSSETSVATYKSQEWLSNKHQHFVAARQTLQKGKHCVKEAAVYCNCNIKENRSENAPSYLFFCLIRKHRNVIKDLLGKWLQCGGKGQALHVC